MIEPLFKRSFDTESFNSHFTEKHSVSENITAPSAALRRRTAPAASSVSPRWERFVNLTPSCVQTCAERKDTAERAWFESNL